MFERADINITGLGLQSEPWIQWTDPVVEPQAERREEWRIFARLAQELGFRGPLDADDPETELWARIDHMLTGRGHSLDEVRAAPKGTVVFEDGLIPGGFYERHLQHTDGRVDCCPTPSGRRSVRLPTRPSPRPKASISEKAAPNEPPRHADAQLVVLQRREPETGRPARTPRWTSTSTTLTRLGVTDGDRVAVRSDWGEIEAAVRVVDDVRPGVVSIQHGWGRQSGMRLATDKPGVNVNRLLPSGPGLFDPLSNQAWMTGIPVTVTSCLSRDRSSPPAWCRRLSRPAAA